MRKRLLRTLTVLLLLLTIIATGCQRAAESNGEQTDGNPLEVNGQEEADGKIENGAESEEWPEGEEEGEPEADYSDRVFDRSLTEGKLCVYFIQADNNYAYDTGSQHAGDSMILIAPDGTTMLIDMNSPSNSAPIVGALQRLGIDTIDYLVVSHQHMDHIGGYPAVLRYIKINHVLTNHHEYTGSATYQGMHEEFEAHGIPVTYVAAGETYKFGSDVEMQIYNPSKEQEDWKGTENQNNGSVLLKLVYGDSSFLFGGDLYASQEHALVEKYGDQLHADVIKMNHHGYDTSNTKEWVQTVNAKIAGAMMSSVTSELVMYRYAAVGTITLHTAMDGAYVIYTGGDGKYEVQVSKERWMSEYGTLDLVDGHMIVE